MLKTLRTTKTESIYQKHLESLKRSKIDKKLCPLCEEQSLVKSFKYWKIIRNAFPYDKISSKHDMILPFRHVVENKFNKKELAEFKKIKNNFINKSDYNFIIETTLTKKTIPNHFHLHLITLKQ